MYEVILKQNALLTDLLKKLLNMEQPVPVVKIDSPVVKVENKTQQPDVRISPPVNNITVEQPVNNITIEPSKPTITIQKDTYNSIEIEIERDNYGDIQKLICKKIK